MANKLELTWVGKEKKIVVEPRILIADPEKSHHAQGNLFDQAADDNMLIHGDNLLALKSLEVRFAGQVKCIYIDPPYNTGYAFEHYDDNLEHSQWLNLMRPRLEILRNLLSEDGSIWISIDDDEGHYLKVLCDELFGRGNFVSTVIWEKKYTIANDTQWLSDNHDFILVYAKNKDRWHPNLLPRSEEMNKAYKNPDNHPKGVWKSTPLHAKSGSETSASFSYTFNVTARTLWRFDEVGHNHEAREEVKHFNPTSVFATPKPERLIERILVLGSNPGDLVLDSFLGSGTTAAVAHKMGRRWIGIEMGDHAYTHCKVRLDKVINGEDRGGITKAVKWKGGGGYTFYELAPSLINRDAFDEPVINKAYNAEQLAAAVALHEGFRFQPDRECFWKQSVGNERSYLFVTTAHITSQYLDSIHGSMAEGEFLIIAAKSFDRGIERAYREIAVKKIPQMLLDRCEFGVENYNLNIVHPPVYEDEEDCNE